MKVYQNELARIVDIEENRYIFENGTCEVENKDHIAILKELGYLVDEIQEEIQDEIQEEIQDENQEEIQDEKGYLVDEIQEEAPKKTARSRKKVDEWD